MYGILFLIRFDSIPKQHTILEIKSLQNTTELAYFTLCNHTSGQHKRFTSHSKSCNSIKTSDQKNNSIAILDIRWPTRQKIFAKNKNYQRESNPQPH